METSEFDKFAEEYEYLMKKSTKLSGENPDYFHEYKIRDLKGYHGKDNHNVETILDFGSGVGNSLPFLKKYFPESKILALDVSPKSIEIAKKRFPNVSEFIVFDGHKIPLNDNSLDCVIICCVLHHILHSQHHSLFSEILRVLKPGKSVFIYEHNPLNPLTVKTVRDCPFDKDAVLINSQKMNTVLNLAGFKNVKIRYKVFFPQFLSALSWLEPYIAWLPLGAQYRATGLKP